MAGDASEADVGRWVATLRSVVERAGALCAVVLLDRGEATPLLIDVSAGGAVELAEGERAVELDPEALGGAQAADLPEIRTFPPMDVDAGEGRITGPIGALEHQARAVRALGSQLPGRSVLTLGFETSDEDAPLFIAARSGEPVVVSIGEAQFELPERSGSA